VILYIADESVYFGPPHWHRDTAISLLRCASLFRLSLLLSFFLSRRRSLCLDAISVSTHGSRNFTCCGEYTCGHGGNCMICEKPSTYVIGTTHHGWSGEGLLEETRRLQYAKRLYFVSSDFSRFEWESPSLAIILVSVYWVGVSGDNLRFRIYIREKTHALLRLANVVSPFLYPRSGKSLKPSSRHVSPILPVLQ